MDLKIKAFTKLARAKIETHIFAYLTDSHHRCNKLTP